MDEHPSVLAINFDFGQDVDVTFFAFCNVCDHFLWLEHDVAVVLEALEENTGQRPAELQVSLSIVQERDLLFSCRC